MNNDVIAWRLKKLRKVRSLSQKELAEVIGVQKNTVSTWERGTRIPDYPALRKLAAFFEVSLDYLMGETMNSDRLEEVDSGEQIRREGLYPQWKEIIEKLPYLSKESRNLLRDTAELLFKKEGID